MEFQTVVDTVRSWPIEERIRLANLIHDDLDLTPETIQQLDRRIADVETNPDDGLTWDEVLASARVKAASMTWEIKFRKAASSEFAKAYQYYGDQREGLGEEFAACVQDAIDVLQMNPKVHPVVYKDVRRAVVQRFPYCIYYLIKSNRVSHHFGVPHEPESAQVAVTRMIAHHLDDRSLERVTMMSALATIGMRDPPPEFPDLPARRGHESGK